MIRGATPADAPAPGAMHAAARAETYPPLVAAGRLPPGPFVEMIGFVSVAPLAAGFGVPRAAELGDAGAWCVTGNAPAERFHAARGAVAGPRRIGHRGPHAIAETGWIWRALSQAARPG